MDKNQNEILNVSAEAVENSVSPLRMSKFHFTNMQMSFNGELVGKPKMSVSVAHELVSCDTDIIEVSIDIKSEPSGFRLQLSAQAMFTVADCGDISENVLVQKNAISIMFPFIRSEVTLLTAQPGMSPIVLPPLNINKFFEHSNNV